MDNFARHAIFTFILFAAILILAFGIAALYVVYTQTYCGG